MGTSRRKPIAVDSVNSQLTRPACDRNKDEQYRLLLYLCVRYINHRSMKTLRTNNKQIQSRLMNC